MRKRKYRIMIGVRIACLDRASGVVVCFPLYRDTPTGVVCSYLYFVNFETQASRCAVAPRFRAAIL